MHYLKECGEMIKNYIIVHFFALLFRFCVWFCFKRKKEEKEENERTSRFENQ